MSHKLSFSKFVMIILVSSFAYVILMASSKLRTKKIGTIFQTIGEKTVQGNSLHFKQNLIFWDKLLSRNQAFYLQEQYYKIMEIINTQLSSIQH